MNRFDHNSHSTGGFPRNDKKDFGNRPRGGFQNDKGFRRNNDYDRDSNFDFRSGPRGPAKEPTPPQEFKRDFTGIIAPVKATPEEIKAWRTSHAITVGVENSRATYDIPPPILTFSEVTFASSIMKEIAHAGFKEPTPIQAQGWSIALRGHDLVGIAKTGSGKTLAFILPALTHIHAQRSSRSGEGPIALVLAPTRELACQIFEECCKFGSSSGVRMAVCYGGIAKYGQASALMKGVDLLIATPGRLIDFLEDGTTNLDRVTYLILDEADRMLDMGFEDQIRAIISQIRPDRQTLMWTATWPDEVKELAHEICHVAPIKIQVGSQDIALNDMIRQQVEIMDEDDKKDRIVEVLKDFGEDDRVLIFVKTKVGSDYLVSHLRRKGFAANVIHGDKTQRERDRVIQEFKEGDRVILVATDVAARGLDIKNIKCVVNYDMPALIEDYVHRVGRTGRAGTKGFAISFFTVENAKLTRDLISLLRDTKQEIPQDLYHFNSRGSRPRSRPKTGRGGYNGGGGGFITRAAGSDYNSNGWKTRPPKDDFQRPPTYGRRDGGGNNNNKNLDPKFGDESFNVKPHFMNSGIRRRTPDKPIDIKPMETFKEAPGPSEKRDDRPYTAKPSNGYGNGGGGYNKGYTQDNDRGGYQPRGGYQGKGGFRDQGGSFGGGFNKY